MKRPDRFEWVIEFRIYGNVAENMGRHMPSMHRALIGAHAGAIPQVAGRLGQVLFA